MSDWLLPVVSQVAALFFLPVRMGRKIDIPNDTINHVTPIISIFSADSCEAQNVHSG